jgi:hypothetical protein
MKICYWIFIITFSIVFLYFSGIDTSVSNFHNKRVEALLFGLVVGIILIYINIFWRNYPLEDKLLSSFAYLFCLCLMSFIFKPLLYDSSSYPGFDFFPQRDMAILSPVVGMVITFSLYILNDGGFTPKI